MVCGIFLNSLWLSILYGNGFIPVLTARLVKELVILSGYHLSYQTHRHRTEIWTFTEGTGELLLDGAVSTVHRGDTAVISPGVKHAILARTELHIIEVQIGDELTEDDIERFDWEWD